MSLPDNTGSPTGEACELAPVRETKRHQEALKYLFASSHAGRHGFDQPYERGDSEIIHVPPPGHNPTHAGEDATLIALAQLTAIKLDCSRSLVSLVDTSTQYVLAEASPNSRLKGCTESDREDSTWLGFCAIPRHLGLCEATMELTPRQILDGHVVEFLDLEAEARYASVEYHHNGRNFRYHASAPLLSPRGIVIGTLCVFDHEPRSELMDPAHLRSIHDLATLISDHLELRRSKEEQQLGRRMLDGLTDFVRGEKGGPPDPKRQKRNTSASKARLRSDVRPLDPQSTTLSTAARVLSNNDSPAVVESRPTTPENTQDGDLRNLATLSLQAARLIAQTSQFEGVTIFDASLAGLGVSGQKRSPRRPSGRSGDSLGASSSASASDNQPQAPLSDAETCAVLGSYVVSNASIQLDSNDRPSTIANKDLRRLIKMYPSGHICAFDDGGAPVSTDQEHATYSTSEAPEEVQIQESTRKRSRRSAIRAAVLSTLVHSLAGDEAVVRNLVLLPLWDPDAQRWFGIFACWSLRPTFVVAEEHLAYVRAFAHSYMTAVLVRREAEVGEAKAAFMATISHELRSPLHGILGSVELLGSTDLTTTQSSAVHAIQSCGRTLLDTIDHILEFAKSKSLALMDNKAVVRVKDLNSVRWTPRPMRRQLAVTRLSTTVDLAILSEEVVEAVFAGQSFRTISHNLNYDNSAAGFVIAQAAEANLPPQSRKLVYVVLDIPSRNDWNFSLPAGAMRRILMNVFGNALRYTESGFIKVTLRIEDSKRKASAGEKRVSIEVSDTGIGMTPEFLANKAFQPFKQENSFTAGLGLGLSVVWQIVQTLGGTVDIRSDFGKGTTVTVKLHAVQISTSAEPQIGRSLPCSPEEFFHDRKVSLLLPSTWAQEDDTERQKAIRYSVESLHATLTDWLELNVSYVTKRDYHGADIVFCCEPDFEYLKLIRADRKVNQKAPVTVFLAIDAAECAALQSDARVLDKESVVEIVTQPLGPLKLARLMQTCAARYFSNSENIAARLGFFEDNEAITHEPAKEPTNGVEPASPQHYESAALQIPSPYLGPRAAGATIDSSVNVLIVDDDSINRRILATLLKNREVTCEQAVNGLDAVNKYREHHTPFTIVLMDISMPVMDGVTATVKIRAYEHRYKRPRAMIIALTALASVKTREEMLHAGADYYMTKPVNFVELMALLPRG